MAVIKADKTGMTLRRPDDRHVSQKLLGIDGTHLGITLRLCSARPTSSTPGIVFLGGSHTGGGYGGRRLAS